MAVCDRTYVARGKPSDIEAYVIYLQQRLEYYAEQNEREKRELKAQCAALQKELAALKNKQR